VVVAGREEVNMAREASVRRTVEMVADGRLVVRHVFRPRLEPRTCVYLNLAKWGRLVVGRGARVLVRHRHPRRAAGRRGTR